MSAPRHLLLGHALPSALLDESPSDEPVGQMQKHIRYSLLLLLFVALPGLHGSSSDEKTSEETKTADQQSGEQGSSVRLGAEETSGNYLRDMSTRGVRGKPAGEASGDADFRRYELVAAPIPIVSPTIGNGLAGTVSLAIHLDRDDKKSPPSILGGGFGATSNGTHGWGLRSELFLKEDRYRLLSGLFSGRVNYDYYGTGQEAGENGLPVPVRVRSRGFLVEPKLRVFGRWYLGPRYHLSNMMAEVDIEELAERYPDYASDPDFPQPGELELSARTAAAGVRLERDTRDNQFYPRSGSFFDSKVDWFAPAFASQREYRQTEISYQGYQAVTKKTVIAYRGSACIASGPDVPFFDQCSLGHSKDIRGYAVGKFQDRRLLVGQVEYRRQLFGRLGVAVFAGAGGVAPTFSKFEGKNVLPGGGGGLRFRLAKQNPINLRIDYAWGVDSSAFYVALGEAF